MSALKRFQKFLLSPTEWVLVQEAKLGDREAFGRLYQLYLDRIYRFVFFRVGQNREIAEDIVSDVFLKAWQKLENFKNESFQAWLYTIARNRVIDFYRSTKKQVILDETIQSDTETIEDAVLRKLEVEKIKQAVSRLTDDQQEVIVLKFIEDVSNTEIATIMGKREDAIRALQSRAIKELRRVLMAEEG